MRLSDFHAYQEKFDAYSYSPIDVATTRQDVVARGFSWSYLMPRSSKSPTPVDLPPLEPQMELHIEGGMPSQMVERLPYDFQGSESVMYELPHGWYGVPALAKTPTNGVPMDQEKAILEKVGTFSNLSAFERSFI